MEKNNLDKLFRDNLKDFNEVPDEGVWNEIEASLDKKKKKRVIPIWWQLGGVAALIAILFYVVNPFGSSEGTENIIISDTHNNPTTDKKDDFDKDMTPSIVDTETTEITSTSSEKNEILLDNGKSSITSKTNDDKIIDPAQNTNAAIVNIDQSTQTEKLKYNQITDSNFGKKNNEDNVITDVKTKDGAKIKDNTAISNQDFIEKTIENAVAEIDTVDIKNKISIFDAIAEQQNDDKEVIVEKSPNRWAMGPSVAPVYFDAQGQGSPIHSNFAANSKSGNVNLSYGLQVSYGVSKKLSIRTGVHKVDFGYDTNDVVFSSSLQASTNDLIDNISYSQASRNLVVQSKPQTETSAVSDNSSAEFNASSPALEGRMVQQMGYLEVPFELNYALIDKKLGVNVIGGVSSLFLIDNSVSLESEGLVTEMGQANNVNDVNFSTNIGLGFNYKFSQKIQLNLEPVFKYQLNTFSDTAGRFRPYTIGVYSGVSFKF